MIVQSELYLCESTLFILSFLTFYKESFIRWKKKSFQFVSQKKTFIRMKKFFQTYRKSALIGRVKFVHAFFKLSGNARGIFTKCF